MLKNIKEEIISFIVLKYLYSKKRNYNFVIYNDWIGYNIIKDGYYEEKELFSLMEGISDLCKMGVALDVGANIGNHTVYFSKHFAGVKAFEPQKRTFKILSLNTERLSNVEIFNYGFSVVDMELDFIVPFFNSGLASQNNSTADAYVEKVKLGNSLVDLKKCEISFIKVDVEGNEIDVFRCLKEVIVENKPIIAFELNKDANHDVVELIKSFGYTNFYKIESGGQSWISNGNSLIIKLVRFINRIAKAKSRKEITRIEKFENTEYPLVICVHSKSTYQLK